MDVIKAQALSNLSGVVHGFFNRSLGDSLDAALELSGLSSIHTLNQVHSATLRVVDCCESVSPAEGDGLVCGLPACGVGVYTADCVPILLAARDSSVVAAVHAGWRGTLAGITTRALSLLDREFGVPPSDVVAAIGPSIGGCCYEIGRDVAERFIEGYGRGGQGGVRIGQEGREGFSGFITTLTRGKFLLDLGELNRMLLADAGVGEVEVLDICTKCEASFYSYRREGKGVGSQLSFIGIV